MALTCTPMLCYEQTVMLPRKNHRKNNNLNTNNFLSCIAVMVRYLTGKEVIGISSTEPGKFI
jgi:hypothetical protein